jgi:hypothetical protein
MPILPGLAPWFKQGGPLKVAGASPEVKLVDGDHVPLRMQIDPSVRTAITRFVDTQLLGKAKVSGLAYETADDSPTVIDTDYFGQNKMLSPRRTFP